jgi:hypothetical protein
MSYMKLKNKIKTPISIRWVMEHVVTFVYIVVQKCSCKKYYVYSYIT